MSALPAASHFTQRRRIEFVPGGGRVTELMARPSSLFQPGFQLSYLATAALLVWLIYTGSTELGYNWQWYRVPRFILLPDGSPGPLLQGAGITLMVSGLGLCGAAALALTTALMLQGGWSEERRYVLFMVFTGCLIDKIFPNIAHSTLKVLDHCGVGVYLPEGQGCCGI